MTSNGIFKTPKKVLIEATVFNKTQKELLMDLTLSEKKEVIKSSTNSITYRVTFFYSINFNAFQQDYKSIKYPWRFKWKKI